MTGLRKFYDDKIHELEKQHQKENQKARALNPNAPKPHVHKKLIPLTALEISEKTTLATVEEMRETKLMTEPTPPGPDGIPTSYWTGKTSRDGYKIIKLS